MGNNQAVYVADTQSKPSSLWLMVFWVLLAVLVLWPCLETQLVGFISDDGIYALSAKALGMGQGMQMPHMVTHPTQTRYPVGYPLLLMPLWWVFPDSPGNMLAFSAYTLLWSLLGLILADRVMQRVFQWPGWARRLLQLAVLSNFFFLFYATTVMSEGPYLAFSMAAVLAAWHWLQQPDSPQGKRWFLVLTGLSVALFHLRIMGITFMGAVVVWLLLLRRYKCAWGFGVVTLLTTVLPWFVFLTVNRPATLTQDNLPFFTTLCDYFTVMKLEIFSQTSQPWVLYATRIQTALSEWMLGLLMLLLPALTSYIILPEAAQVFKQWPWLVTVQDILTLIGIFAIALRLLLPVIRHIPRCLTVTHYTIQGQMMWLISLYIGLYFAMMTLWAYPGQSYRFLTVLLPLLWGVLMGVWPKTRPRLTSVFLIIACGWCWQSYQMVLDMRQHSLIAHQANLRHYWPNLKRLYQFINHHVPKNAIIGTGRGMPLYLHTGHQTFHLFTDVLLPGVPVNQALNHLEVLMDKHHVTYVVLDLNVVNYKLGKVPVNPLVNDLIAHSPKRYKVIYTSPQGLAVLLARKPLGQQFNEPTGVVVKP